MQYQQKLIIDAIIRKKQKLKFWIKTKKFYGSKPATGSKDIYHNTVQQNGAGRPQANMN